jgi:large subunit ribosomal protein L22
MNIIARASFVRQSPRKLRRVADVIRDLPVERAVASLKLMPQRGAKPILAVYQQALGNAKNNFKVSPGELKVKSLMVEEGPRGPRRPDVHAHGARFDRGIRRRRFSHIKLILDTENGTKS